MHTPKSRELFIIIGGKHTEAILVQNGTVINSSINLFLNLRKATVDMECRRLGWIVEKRPFEELRNK